MTLHPAFLPGLLIAICAFFVLLCLTRLRQRRLLAAGRAGISACLTGALATVVIALALNLYTYRRLSYEQPLAELVFHRIAPQRFAVILKQPGQPDRRAQLAGDEWQLDVRLLKWRPAANLLGFDALARLQRLSGRYQDIHQENNAPQHALSLQTTSSGLDTWGMAQSLPWWLPLVDARYGSATFLPMADGARYRVTLSQSGLVARPTNDAAKRAIRRWWD